MQLNKYLAYAGISSRRKSVDLIKQGFVSINNAVIDNPAYIVQATDQVRLKKKLIEEQKNIYILMNKPKAFITSTADEHSRATVMNLLDDTVRNYRLYPVGRLDRETTGLLLITNDGVLAQKLLHPRYEVSKTYVVTVDRPFQHNDYELLIKEGVMLVDGKAEVDKVVYLNRSKTRLKVILHSGKNRIIRRIFAKLNYNVIGLDRIGYADLSKRNLSIGRWRFLTKTEVASLQTLK